MAMNDLRIKVRLDITSDAEDTCEGCRWALAADGGTTRHCIPSCGGCGDSGCKADALVEVCDSACLHYEPSLRARQVRALEGILTMMKRERVDGAGEAVSGDVGASVAEFADAVRHTVEASRRHPGIRARPKIIDTPCPNCGYPVVLPGAGVKVTCGKCGTKLEHRGNGVITVEPPDNP